MKTIKGILNALHIIYCAICFCALDMPILLRWEWHCCNIEYNPPIPLFIWGIIRLIKESKKEQDLR